MLNPEEIDDETLSDILENMPDHWNDEQKLANLKNSSVHEAFDRFLTWNGIIGYESMISRAFRSLLTAEVPLPDQNEGVIEPDGLEKAEELIANIHPGEVMVVTVLSNGKLYARKLEEY